MQDRRDMSDRYINDTLLNNVMGTVPLFWWVLLGTGFVGSWMLISFGLLFTFGLGLTGLGRPNFWGFMITNFVFWVGISHAGTMISSILRLTQAEWKRPVTRAAEVMTVFALGTAALFPVMHIGRPWRALYWFFPYDFNRGVWPNVRSPLVWDPSAIFTYLSSSAMFVYVALIPDLAILRDRNTGWRRSVYGALALGWRGNPRQWRLQGIVGFLLSALILPVFVSVHSIVSWDFAVSLVPIWHATVFAPYFVIGAVHSGVSAVLTLMAVMRWLFKWDDYLRPEHFDAIGRLLIAVATAWLYFFLLDVFYAVYSNETSELTVMNARFFVWPWNMLAILIFTFGYFIPVPLWLFKRVRTNIPAMFATSILVNIAMWSERYWLIEPGLQYKERLSFDYTTYFPSVAELGLVIGSFGFVATALLLFSKAVPLIPLWEQKEGQVFKDEIRVGRRRIPAIIKEG
ncbi:MAG: polysulfide reductase NrfD [Chloroflexi bacterium]|nr:polysulfide reductase NrfD [Chloroflexota bacterium]